MKNSEISPALKIIETALACQERMNNDPKFRDEIKGFTTAHSRIKKLYIGKFFKIWVEKKSLVFMYQRTQ